MLVASSFPNVLARDWLLRQRGQLCFLLHVGIKKPLQRQRQGLGAVRNRQLT
ncbi:Uncharacterised protein [Comamonas aquatica]|jgi:hypothetical protein|nr:Uncharacterised protein [Comamonas aquatica]CAC9167581.1 Uncharacterised protein [Comamonas aquatica]